MICLECGSKIPFWGNVCPHCRRDKSVSQTLHVKALVGILGGITVIFILAIIGARFSFTIPQAVLLALITAFVIKKYRSRKK